jgi:muramoyltetrapeptide carboxypeptidase
VVRVVSPSGPVDPGPLARGVTLLTGWGLRVEVATHALDRNGYLAGSDADRLADLNAALTDPRVRAVVCSRGGYGVQRIVDGLNLAAARADPKIIVGFSDITALQLALWRGAGLPTLHGPGVAWGDERTPAESAESLRAAVTSTAPVVLKSDPTDSTAAVRFGSQVASGVLLGGNLSLLAASMGTPDQPDLRGAVLLLEEVGEAPYRVDRMLTQLQRAGSLDGLAGIAVGQFTRCGGEGAPVSAVDVLCERLGALGVPVLGGLPIGHGLRQLTVPLGTLAALDVDAGTLTVESVVR